MKYSLFLFVEQKIKLELLFLFDITSDKIDFEQSLNNSCIRCADSILQKNMHHYGGRESHIWSSSSF